MTQVKATKGRVLKGLMDYLGNQENLRPYLTKYCTKYLKKAAILSNAIL